MFFILSMYYLRAFYIFYCLLENHAQSVCIIPNNRVKNSLFTCSYFPKSRKYFPQGFFPLLKRPQLSFRFHLSCLISRQDALLSSCCASGFLQSTDRLNCLLTFVPYASKLFTFIIFTFSLVYAFSQRNIFQMVSLFFLLSKFLYYCLRLKDGIWY